MRKHFTLFIITLFIVTNSFASFQPEPYNKTFVKNKKEKLNYQTQQRLREKASWREFSAKHKQWNVIFDERSTMPHRAYGKGFLLTGTDATDRAKNFIHSELNGFGVSNDELTLRNSFSSKKYHYVDFYQVYNGLEVLNSRVTVRSTLDNRIVLFGADVFNDIQISVQPQLDAASSPGYAVNGIAYEITGYWVNPDLKILPVPSDSKYEYHLVYEVTVKAKDFDGYPARYYTLVDANNGDVLYRHNQIDQFNSDATVIANVSDPNPYEPTVIHNLPNLRIKISGTDYYTDNNGLLDLTGITLPATATIYLQGTWSKVTVNTSSSVSNFNQDFIVGSNTANFDGHATLQQISAYYHVNTIHDFMKSYLPDYTEMDVTLPTIVDETSGNCNAFYDGSSINFYAQSNGCFDLALTGDVVYHEYSHGTDERFYSLYSNGLDNGAMDEGYADAWAIGKTDNPIIGIGISDTDPNAYVRRYDINKKVYPQDIQGEVHADGEIICGCWYDTRLNLGSVDAEMTLFTEALYGLADGFDGQEGQVYTDVLIDALTADDDNGDLSDGTPHDIQILDAFAIHGITLIGTIDLQHTEPLEALSTLPITIQANIDMDYPFYFGGATLFYKLNTVTAYDSVGMSLVNGDLYEGQIPAQPQGSILDYYFKVKDIYGASALTQPHDIFNADPNLPYKLLVGFQPLIEEDLENYAGAWHLGDVNDNAQTGIWTMDDPVASYITIGVPSSMVQTNQDHTPTNNLNICAITGNAQQGDAAGTNDVDEGATTLYSPKYDLTEYQLPAISYYRWYSNDQGANPGNDPWRVYITNGDGNWVDLENTHTPDHSWRGNAFRVADYVSITDQVQLKFVASDSVKAGVDLDGQSLVEAGIDDLFVWDLGDNVGINEISKAIINIYPNPANERLLIQFSSSFNKPLTLLLTNALGQIVYSASMSAPQNPFMLSTKEFAPGIYTLDIISDGNSSRQKFVVQH